jgi:hypothetical protein
MRPLGDIAREMAQSIDRRFGIDDVDGLAAYLTRSLRDVVQESRADTAVPEFADPVDALARYLARREGHDPQNPSLYLYHRQDAVLVLDALNRAGVSLIALAGFFLVETPEDKSV